MEKYGRYTLIEFSHSSANHQAYWKAKCVCGTIKTVRLARLKSGETISCGCYGREQISKSNTARRMPLLERKKNMLFSYFKAEADKRSLIFEFDRDECYEMSQKECFYCGVGPSNEKMMYLKSDRSKFKYNGLDRVDNSLGYWPDNVVTCCENCNKAKRMMSQDEFFDLIKKIYERRFKK